MAVKIYTTPGCPYCRMAKAFLGKKGVKFEEFNVEKNAAAAAEMVRKSRQMGVPVIEVNGKIIVGFDKPSIEAALQR